MPTPLLKDYYLLLGIESSADLGEVKTAYRRLALRWHPDRNPGNPLAERRFREIAEAYYVLGDGDRRSRYDRKASGPHPTRETRSRKTPESDARAQVDELFADLTAETFRRPVTGALPVKGEDLRYPLTVDFTEAVFGTEREIVFTARRPCASCQSTGARPGSPLTPCPVCFGAGKTEAGTRPRACETCLGAGVLAVEACRACRGKGSIPVRHRLTLTIPPGCESGARLRVPGQGEPGLHGGPPGDLYGVVTVREHPLFTRQGYDIICELPLTYGQAVLGAELMAPTVDGPERIVVPPGTLPGDLLTLPGKGIPRGSRPGDRGDHKFLAMIDVPKQLTPRQKELLEAFEKTLAAQKDSAVGRFWSKVARLFG